MSGSGKTEELEVGQIVRHPMWGLGTVLHCSGKRDKKKVIVLFQDVAVGQRTLSIKYAKLERVESRPIFEAQADEDPEKAGKNKGEPEWDV